MTSRLTYGALASRPSSWRRVLLHIISTLLWRWVDFLFFLHMFCSVLPQRVAPHAWKGFFCCFFLGGEQNLCLPLQVFTCRVRHLQGVLCCKTKKMAHVFPSHTCGFPWLMSWPYPCRSGVISWKSPVLKFNLRKTSNGRSVTLCHNGAGDFKCAEPFFANLLARFCPALGLRICTDTPL